MCCEGVGSSEGSLLRLSVRARAGEKDRVLVFDESSGRLSEDGAECYLTSQQARVVGALICHAGRAVNTAELVNHVWGWGSKHALYAAMSRAKKRLLIVGIEPFWEIRWGFGYAVWGRLEVLRREPRCELLEYGT